MEETYIMLSPCQRPSRAVIDLSDQSASFINGAGQRGGDILRLVLTIETCYEWRWSNIESVETARTKEPFLPLDPGGGTIQRAHH
jgi:hypothetical protein